MQHTSSRNARSIEAAVVAGPQASPRLRLTPRGRRVIGGLLAAPIALGIVFASLSPATADASQEEAQPLQSVTVTGGESLWSIAEEHADGRDVRDVVDEIMRINNLAEPKVAPGQQLLLPNH